MRVWDQLKADEEEEKVNGFSIEVSPMGSSTDGYYQVEKKVEKEKEPSHLNTNNTSGGFLVVSPDKLSVQYTNVHLHGHDVGVVQANHPAPSRRLVYYFEIFVKNAGAKGQIAIGFTSQDFKMRRQPGIIRSYLLHYGYEETLQSFDLASKSTLPPVPLVQENGFDEQGVIYELNRRKTLRQLIRSGDMDSTFSKLREWYPQILRCWKR